MPRVDVAHQVPSKAGQTEVSCKRELEVVAGYSFMVHQNRLVVSHEGNDVHQARHDFAWPGLVDRRCSVVGGGTFQIHRDHKIGLREDVEDGVKLGLCRINVALVLGQQLVPLQDGNVGGGKPAVKLCHRQVGRPAENVRRERTHLGLQPGDFTAPDGRLR